MKRTLLIIFAGVAALMLANCGDSVTGSDPNKDPAIAVNQTDITLSGSERWDRFNLMNGGGGQLEWKIDAKPDWIDVSAVSGIGLTASDTTTIRLTTRFDKLDYGSYTGEIRISSNGGAVTIVVKLSYQPPKLKVENGIINMDRHYRYSELIIINEGGGELEWRIASRPAWLQFDVDSGTVYNHPEQIPFRAQVQMLEYGDYTDKVSIESNGGSHEINVYLRYEREVEVYAGVGAANVNIGDTYLMVERLYGKPTQSGYVRPEKTVFIHNVDYLDLGLEFRIKNNSPILFGSGQVGYIRMMQPYDGLTPELIGLGSSSSDLVNTYGEPLEKSGAEWRYEEITYIIRNNKVSEMIIQEPGFLP
ncbi:BACON domain-containing protein [candidate division KSB1 bacterium]|nr:BACON domain-containing protein [candidate division KSB1 bacterium]